MQGVEIYPPGTSVLWNGRTRVAEYVPASEVIVRSDYHMNRPKPLPVGFTC